MNNNDSSYKSVPPYTLTVPPELSSQTKTRAVFSCSVFLADRTK